MWVHRLHAAGAKVWMQCASVEQALDAAALGVDAIIAQGTEAGGHTKSTTRMVKLVPAIADAVRPIMVLAAGGIADSEKVVIALSHGAEGVWVGTRLIASTEAYAHPEHQRRILAASGNDSSVITTMFGPEYPNRTCRVLRNRVVNEFAGREDQIPNPPPPPAVIGTTVLLPLTFPTAVHHAKIQLSHSGTGNDRRLRGDGLARGRRGGQGDRQRQAGR